MQPVAGAASYGPEHGAAALTLPHRRTAATAPTGTAPRWRYAAGPSEVRSDGVWRGPRRG